jgi:hypothetical protein
LRTGVAHAEYRVVVDVDQIDPEAREGRVVLVQGTAHQVDTEAEHASISDVGLEPWAEGEPEHFIPGGSPSASRPSASARHDTGSGWCAWSPGPEP